MNGSRWFLSACASALVLVACDDPAPAPASSGAPMMSSSSLKATASSSAKPGPSASAMTSAAKPPVAFKADPEVVKLIKAVAAGCEVPEDAWISKCTGGETDALGKYVNEKKPEAFYGTAADLALNDGAKDKKLWGAAINAFNQIPNDRDFLKKNATPETAALVAKLFPLVKSEASMFTTSATAMMLLAGKRSDLTAMLNGKDVSDDVKSKAWLYYATYGGVDAIDDLRAATKSDNASVRYNAAWSPGVAIPGNISKALGSSSGPSDADKAKLCDFAKELIASDDDKVVSGAADSLGRCGGAYIDAAIEGLSKKIAGPKVPEGIINGIYHQCWAEGLVGGAPNGTKEQCDKALDLLTKITEIKDVDTGTLSTTLWALGYVGKNGGDDTLKKSKTVLAKFKTHKDKSVADNAKRDYTK
jgi:hypothetical protein